MNITRNSLKPVFLLSSFLGAFSVSVQADSARIINPASNHIYQRFDSSKTWAQAKSACDSRGGYLATITSQAENDLLVSNGLVGANAVWLGGTDSITEGQWQWITGEVWGYANWNTSQPDNGNGGKVEHYLQAVSGSSLWNDWVNSGAISYLCEWNSPLKTYTSLTIADTDNNGSTEFILVGNNSVTLKVLSYDRVSQAIVSDVSFLNLLDYRGGSLSVVDDMNGNGRKEFVLLMTKKSDNSSVIETRDSGTGALLESYAVPR